jgi:hypothetical protein
VQLLVVLLLRSSEDGRVRKAPTCVQRMQVARGNALLLRLMAAASSGARAKPTSTKTVQRGARGGLRDTREEGRHRATVVTADRRCGRGSEQVPTARMVVV